MRNRSPSVRFNMVMNAILTMSSFIFPLITFPYVSRILLPLGTGKVNFVTSTVAYFAMFSQLGIPTYGVRACARVRDDRQALSRTVQELLIINLFTCLLTYLVFAGAILCVPRFRAEYKLFIIIGLSIGLNALGVEWLYRALEQYRYITVRSMIFKAVAVGATFLLIHNPSDYVIYGAISIFAASASNVLNFWNLRKHITLKPLGQYHFKKHLSMILIFFSMSVASTVYTNLDNVMLGMMRGDIDVGYYSAAVKIKNILISLVTSVSAVLLPRASYYVDQHRMDEFYQIIRRTMHFVLLLALPMTVYFMLFAQEGILLLSGSAYLDAVRPMQIIMPTLLLVGMTNVIGIQMMVPLGQEKHVLFSEIAGAVTDLVLNWILIPRLASVGAAIGTLAAETVVLVWQSAVLSRGKAHLYRDVSWWRLLTATALGTAACLWVKCLSLGSFWMLVISAILFFGVYAGIQLATKEPLVCELFHQIVVSRLKRHKS